MPCYIQGLGTAVPERWLTAEQSGQLLSRTCPSPRGARLLRRIAPLTGIERRHLAALDYTDQGQGDSRLYRPAREQPLGPGMEARNALFDAAAEALVCRALSKFSHERLARVGTLVTASCTHASAPGLERPILTHTPVPASVQRWNLGFMGCSAGLAAIRLVLQTADVGHASLVVACELSSLHFQYTDELDQMTANLLFADGSGAVLLSAEPSPIRVIRCACATLPASADEMVWFAGDHGLQLRLSQGLPSTLGEHLPEIVAGFLQAGGMSMRDVDHWLVHPGGPQILDSVERSLGLANDALDASRSVLRRYGNMSSPTIFFIMRDVFDSGSVGSAVVMAFGPGLTIELALLQMSATVEQGLAGCAARRRSALHPVRRQ